jgi:hypothetical protein
LVVSYFALGLLLNVAVSIFWLSKLSKLSKLRGDSRTKFGSTVTVVAPYDVVFTRCEDIMRSLKATILLIDYDGGVIESERQSFWRAPFKLNVKMSRVGEDRCSVCVESDATVPIALFDFGKNGRRVRRFVRDLTS